MSPSNRVSFSDFCSTMGISIGVMFRCGLETLIFRLEMSDNGSPETFETKTLIVF